MMIEAAHGERLEGTENVVLHFSAHWTTGLATLRQACAATLRTGVLMSAEISCADVMASLER
jgi:hypothetical protein